MKLYKDADQKNVAAIVYRGILIPGQSETYLIFRDNNEKHEPQTIPNPEDFDDEDEFYEACSKLFYSEKEVRDLCMDGSTWIRLLNKEGYVVCKPTGYFEHPLFDWCGFYCFITDVTGDSHIQVFVGYDNTSIDLTGLGKSPE